MGRKATGTVRILNNEQGKPQWHGKWIAKARTGTKTDAPRTVPTPAPLLPLLEVMHDDAGGEGLVCRKLASQRAMARGLRTWLRKAGVTRSSLFDDWPVNLNLRWHDLRATCGTWLAVQGRCATEIRDVLGHTQTSMTARSRIRDAPHRIARSGARGQTGPPPPAGWMPSRVAGWTGLESTTYQGEDGACSSVVREFPEHDGEPITESLRDALDVWRTGSDARELSPPTPGRAPDARRWLTRLGNGRPAGPLGPSNEGGLGRPHPAQSRLPGRRE